MAPWGMPTALVTGASAGLGHAYARHLAAEGYDLVLVARDEARLTGIAEQLSSQHDVTVEVLPADLTDIRQCQRVERRVAATMAHQVDLLVNNAGVGSDGLFWEASIEAEERLLRLNVRAVMRLTHAALRSMVAREGGEGSGEVLTVSSMAALSPMPRGGSYSASKAYVSTLMQSLHVDLAGSGVRVCVVEPGLIRTEFQERAGIELSLPEALWLSPEQVVSRSLHDLRCGRPVSVPGTHYQAVGAVMRYAPRRVALPIYRELRRRVG